MALPADFNKIFGSTATGGITPTSDVNYAKGWEFVGANPPTKNDFSYLQNLSDLKSQWLYSNKLQRADPFGDIKSDGAAAVSTAISNLGLGDLVNALIKTNNLSDLSSIPTARTNLGVPKGVDKQMCNEWAVFNGVNTVTIGDSLGISSVTRTGTGQYTVNLSTPYATINYAVAGRWTSSGAQIDRDHELSIIQATKTVNSFQLYCASDSSNLYPATDAVELSLAVWGTK